MPEAKISLPRNPMCRVGAAEVSEMCFPKAFTVIIPQMFVVYGDIGGDIVAPCASSMAVIVYLMIKAPFSVYPTVFQIRFFKHYSILSRLIPFSFIYLSHLFSSLCETREAFVATIHIVNPNRLVWSNIFFQLEKNKIQIY